MTLLDSFEIPLIQATNENLKGYGYLVDDYDQTEIEITTWPKKGWRDIEKGTGNEGGITEGPFETWWQGDILYGRNNAVEHKSDYDRKEKEGGVEITQYEIDRATPIEERTSFESKIEESIYRAKKHLLKTRGGWD